MEKAQRRQRRQFRQTYASKIIKLIYRGINGFNVSSEFREKRRDEGLDWLSLTYGEIDPRSFLQVLLWIEKYDSELTINFSSPRVFVDLGCGVGRACLCAALSVGDMFTVIRGVDIVPELIDMAEIAKERIVSFISQEAASLMNGKGQCTKKSAIDKLNSLSDTEFRIIAAEAINKTDSKEMSVESLANKMCFKVGHKAFKIVVKKHRSFLSIFQNDESFIISSDSKFIRVSPKDILEAAIEESMPNSCDDYHSSCHASESTDDMLSSGAINREFLRPFPSIYYEVNDIFETNWWEDSYVCYVASLLFSDAMMDRLTEQALLLKTGSWLISLKPLVLNCSDRIDRIKLIHDSFFDMSWEMAEVYIYRITQHVL